MKNISYIFLFIFCITNSTNAQNGSVYQNGEWLKFRMHYGFLNAGYATLEVKEENIDHQKLEHVIGKGWTTGMSKWIFPIDNNYQSFINPKTGFPIKAIRKIKEGKYEKNIELFFQKDSVLTVDIRKKKEKKIAAKNVHDMIAAFYYLRNNVPKDIKKDEAVEIDMFFDEKKFPFKLVKLGEEVVNTEFGKINCIKFRPMVQSGRVFKAKESLTMWITADENRIPVRIQADLAVGSLKADLTEYKGLAKPLAIITN